MNIEVVFGGVVGKIAGSISAAIVAAFLIETLRRVLFGAVGGGHATD